MPTFKKIMPVPRVGGDGGGDRLVHPIAGLRRVLAVSKRQRGQNCMLQAGENSLMLSTGSQLGGKPARSAARSTSKPLAWELFTRI